MIAAQCGYLVLTAFVTMSAGYLFQTSGDGTGFQVFLNLWSFLLSSVFGIFYMVVVGIEAVDLGNLVGANRARTMPAWPIQSLFLEIHPNWKTDSSGRDTQFRAGRTQSNGSS